MFPFYHVFYLWVFARARLNKKRKKDKQPAIKKESIDKMVAGCLSILSSLSFMMNGCLLLKVHGQGLCVRGYMCPLPSITYITSCTHHM